MEYPLSALKERFEAAFKASTYTSLRQLSGDSGCSPSLAGKILAGRASKDGPTVVGLWKLANRLGVTLNDLLPPREELVERPGLDKFFARYNFSNPRLDDFKDIIQFCDQYAEPKLGRCQIIKTGPKSLLVEKTQISDIALHQDSFDSWPREKRERIFKWQRRAWRLGAAAEPEDFSGTYKNSAGAVEIPILRAACRVLGDDLKPRLIIYCEQLWQDKAH